MSLLWLIVIPPLAGVLVYPVRKLRWVPGILSAAAIVATGLIAVRLPDSQTMFVMGRPLVFQPLARHLFVLIYGTFALLLLHEGAAASRPLFCPLALMIAGVLSAAVLVRHVALSAVFIELAAVLISLLIPDEHPASARSAMRYLVIATLAMLPLLLAPWAAEIFELNPGDTALPEFILVTIITGFTILLGAIPFHAWLPPIAQHASPAVTAILVGPANLVIWYRLLEALNQYPWIAGDPRLGSLLTGLGMCTTIGGAVLALSQRDLSHLMGYVALSDLGMILLATASAMEAEPQAVLYHWMVRGLAFALMAMCISTLRRSLGSTDIGRLRSAARRFPATTMGLLASGLSLAGLPLTGGFPARWIMVQSMIRASLPQALALLGSSAAVGWVYLRLLSEMLAPPSEPYGAREPRLTSLLIALTTLLLLTTAWYSRPVLDVLPDLWQSLLPLTPGA